MKYNIISVLGCFTLGLGCVGIAQASESGFYTFIGGGGAYLQNAKLSATPVTATQTSATDTTYSIQYQQKSPMTYTGRLAAGYLFPDATNYYAFGLQVGFNYFGPIKDAVESSLLIPGWKKFGVNSIQKTTAWAGDLEAVYTQSLPIKNLSLILQFGMGYESMTQKTTTSVAGLEGTGILPQSSTQHSRGIGAAGGIGFQYALSKHIALQVEFDGFKGKKGLGYAQGLAGIAFMTDN